MGTNNYIFRWGKAGLLALLLFVTQLAVGQTVTIGTGTLTASGTNGTPIYRSTTTSAFHHSKSIQLLTAAQLSAAGLSSGANITGWGYNKQNNGAPSGANAWTLNVYLKNSSATVLATGTAWNTMISGATLAYTATINSGNMPAATGYWVWPTSGFTYAGGAIECYVEWFPAGTMTTPFTTNSFLWQYTASGNQAMGTSNNVVIPGTQTAWTTQARFYNTQINYNTSACSGTPAPGNTTSSATNACANVNFTLGLQNLTSGSGVSYQWQSSPDGVSYSNITGATSASYGTSQTSATYYQCIVTCSGGGSTTSNPVLVNMENFLNCYCSSSATNTADEDIYTVTVNGGSTPPAYAGANNCTAVAPGTGSVLGLYSNFTSIGSLTSLAQGSTVPFTIEENECNAGTYYAFGTSIWVDFNQNGSFLDAGEKVFAEAATLIGPRNVTGTFSVPPTATLGQTRMRIIVVEGSAGTLHNSCGTYTYGETEDFYVDIIANTNCTGTPSPGNTVSSATSACIGVNFNLSLSNNVTGSGITFQWQSSPDGISYTDITGATNSTHTANQSSDNYYQCVVTCSFGGSATSVPVLVTNLNCINMSNGSSSPVCSGTFYDSGGPSAAYAINENLTYTINPVSGNGIVLTFNSFAGESCCDDITIYNGPSTSSPVLLATTGTLTTPVTFTSTDPSGALTIVWTSDGSVQGAGWNASISCYSLTLCSGTPTVGNALSSAPSVCSGVNFNLSMSSVQTDPGTSYQWQSSPDGVTYTDITGATNATYTTSQTAATYYQCVVTCSFSTLSATTSAVQVTMNAPTTCYCTPVTSSGCTDEDVIARVILNTLDNNSGTGCPSGLLGYSDYTGNPLLTTTLVAGTNYGCTVYAGEWSESYAAWIDYDNNGVFDHPSERIGFTATPVPGSGVSGTLGGNATFPVNIACNPTPGTYRLRVRAMFNIAGSAMTPCGNNTFGETEDYLITIAPPPPCPTPFGLAASAPTVNGGTFSWTLGCAETAWELEYGPTGYTPGTGTVVSAPTNPFNITSMACSTAYDVYVRAACDAGNNVYSAWSGPATITTSICPCTFTTNPGNTISSVPSACAGQSFNLSLQNIEIASSINYQWQSSSDGVNYTPITGATNATYAATQSSATYYQCVVTCTGNTSLTSNPVLVGQNAATLCYCVANLGGTATGNCITNVTMAGINNTSGCVAVANGSALESFAPGAGTTATLIPGSSYNLDVTTDGSSIISIWIDYNQDGLYDATEWNQVATASTANTPATISVTIPVTATPGLTGLRIRSRAVGNANGATDACTNFGSGQTEDYQVSIGAPSVSNNGPICAGDTLDLFATPSGATSYAWTGPNGFISAAQNPQILNATVAEDGVYTCVITIGGTPFSVNTTAVVNAKPNVTASSNTNFCSGTSDLNLASDLAGMTTYVWSGPNSFSSAVQNPVIPSAPNTVSGNYTVIVTDANGCKDTSTTNVNIYALPLPEVISLGSGGTTYCTGDPAFDLTTSQPYAGYLWNTTETANFISISSGGTYSVTVTDDNGCENIDNIVINEFALPTAPVVTPGGPLTLCSGDGGNTFTSVTLSVSNYAGTGIDWSNGFNEDQNSSSFDQPGQAYATFTDANGCVSISNFVDLNPRLYSTAASGVIAADTALCNGSNTTLTVDGGMLEDVDTWNWYSGSCGGTAIGSGTSIIVTPSSTTNYFVRAEGSCGSTACANSQVLVFNGSPAGTAQNPILPATGCAGNSFVVTTSVIAGASYYQWSAPAGTTINGQPSPVITSSPSATIVLGPYVSSGWYICVQGGNPCGTTINTKCNWIRGIVTQPGIISGNSLACANTSGNYSIAPVAGAQVYTWAITGDASVSGTGTSVTVNFGPTFTTGTLSVSAGLGCGANSSVRTMTITNNTPMPGVISGSAVACPGATVTYSVAAVPGAVSYNWSACLGATVVNNGTTADITFPASFSHCVISVSANSVCGTASAARSKAITNGTIGTPANITGALANLCGSSNVAYSCASVVGATGYTWSVVGGSIATGQGTSGVTVNWNSSGSVGSLSVFASNACGNGGTRSVATRLIPGLPSAISTLTSVTVGALEGASIPSLGAGVNYTWSSTPAGVGIIGQGANSVQLDYSTVAPGNYTIVCTPSNACGNSNNRTIAVTVAAARMAKQDVKSIMEAIAYPNPAINQLNVKFNSMDAGNYSIRLVDLSGRLVINNNGAASKGANLINLDLNGLAKGVYMLHVENAHETSIIRVVVQ